MLLDGESLGPNPLTWKRPMTRFEMLLRLINGETPVEVSIEKYERLDVRMSYDTIVIKLWQLSQKMCALCFVYEGFMSKSGDCEYCPLDIIEENCFHKFSAYGDMFESLRSGHKERTQSLRYMLHCLNECRDVL